MENNRLPSFSFPWWQAAEKECTRSTLVFFFWWFCYNVPLPSILLCSVHISFFFLYLFALALASSWSFCTSPNPKTIKSGSARMAFGHVWAFASFLVVYLNFNVNRFVCFFLAGMVFSLFVCCCQTLFGFVFYFFRDFWQCYVLFRCFSTFSVIWNIFSKY